MCCEIIALETGCGPGLLNTSCMYKEFSVPFRVNNSVRKNEDESTTVDINSRNSFSLFIMLSHHISNQLYFHLVLVRAAFFHILDGIWFITALDLSFFSGDA